MVDMVALRSRTTVVMMDISIWQTVQPYQQGCEVEDWKSRGDVRESSFRIKREVPLEEDFRPHAKSEQARHRVFLLEISAI